jgi:PRC-barrel domain protein
MESYTTQMRNDTTQTRNNVETEETTRLISSNKVVGTTVYNRQGEHLGSIDGLMMDKYSGGVAYAVMSFGGFLGIGESYHPLPWRVLNYDARQGGYVVDLDRRRLEGAPSYTLNNLPDWTDRSYGRRLDEYYGVPPYQY